MTVILGIDAAWTKNGSTGIALITSERGRFRLITAVSSYRAFVERAYGVAEYAMVGLPDVTVLLDSARCLAGANVDVVAVDMPMSKVEFDSRREADQKISKEFGRYKAGTHSPSVVRPGALGRHISESFRCLGLPLVTGMADIRSPALIEVYPHTALIRLMRCGERRKYKAGKSKDYWENNTIAERISLLVEEWRLIVEALSAEIDDVTLNLPSGFQTLAAMKEYEDRLDAIVSAWVGMKFSAGEAEPFGDKNAAIWVPKC